VNPLHDRQTGGDGGSLRKSPKPILLAICPPHRFSRNYRRPSGLRKTAGWAGFKALFVLLLAPVFFSCARSPDPQLPRWVRDKETAYPNGEWLCFVEFAADRNSAEAAAMNSLARFFRVDILYC
jgi:hypothetical protein